MGMFYKEKFKKKKTKYNNSYHYFFVSKLDTCSYLTLYIQFVVIARATIRNVNCNINVQSMWNTYVSITENTRRIPYLFFFSNAVVPIVSNT